MQRSCPDKLSCSIHPAVNLARLEAIYQQVWLTTDRRREGINLPVARWSSCVFRGLPARPLTTEALDQAISAEN